MRRSRSKSAPTALRRWLRFNFVGLIGVGVQLAVLQSLLLATTLDYKVAALLAVEITVIHNFVWHVRFTWRERQLHEVTIVARRLVTFHLTNGAVSLAGSWTLMALLVGRAGFPVLFANVVSIVACSILNFLLAEVLAFREPRRRQRATKPLHFSHQHEPVCPRCDVFNLHSACGDR